MNKNEVNKKISIIIIDTTDDIRNLYRKYPYPMRVIKETKTEITFENQDNIETIEKNKYKYKILKN